MTIDRLRELWRIAIQKANEEQTTNDIDFYNDVTKLIESAIKDNTTPLKLPPPPKPRTLSEGGKGFRFKKYRIENDGSTCFPYYVYTWRLWFPFWVKFGGGQGWRTIEGAETYFKNYNKVEKEL